MDVRPQLVGLLDYTSRMATIGERAVYRLGDYRALAYHEHMLRNRIGITHDVVEGEERAWLKIDRLSRRDPPPVPEEIKAWVTVGRDPLKPPTVQTMRTVTVTQVEAAILVSTGPARASDVVPALKSRNSTPASDLRDVLLRLENDAKAAAAVARYVDGAWATWSEAEKPRRETIRIYEAFFSLQQAIETEGVERPLEVVWGVGVARWRHPKQEIDHPVIEQLVEIDVDPKDGAIRISARSTEPVVQPKPYQELEIAGADKLQRVAREHFTNLGAETEFSPFVRPTFEPILRKAYSLLDPEGRYHPDQVQDVEDRTVPAAGPTLVVTDTWAIYARPRSANIIVDDIERLKARVGESEPDKLPAAAKRLVSKPDDTRPGGGILLPHDIGAGVPIPGTGDAPGSAQPSAFFFPKPFNDEQVEIVKRLHREDGVVVQGPPGTGKTHTIANIICHYMATGRRVLVVSHGEAALGVLRDQIPAEIRDLAISLLTSERQGLKLLERAVAILADDVSQVNPGSLARSINDGERRVIELKQKISTTEDELRRWAELHLRRLDGGKGPSPMELAKRVVEGRAQYGWFEDRPPTEARPQFGLAEIARLREARKRLGADLTYVGVSLPSTNDLPDPATLAAIHEDLVNAERIAARSRSGDVPSLSVTDDDALVRAEALFGVLDALIAAQAARAAEPWLGRVFAFARERETRVETKAFDHVLELLMQAIEGQKRFLQVVVEVPEPVFKDKALRQGVRDALARQAEGQSAFGFMSFGRGQIKAVYAELRVDGALVSDVETARHVVDYLTWRNVLEHACRRWNRLALEFGWPAVDHEGDAAGRWAAETHGKLAAQLAAALEHAPTAARELPALFPYGVSAEGIADDEATARRAREAIELNLSRRRLERSRVRLGLARERLTKSGAPIIEEMRAFLNDVVGSPVPTGAQVALHWEGLLARLNRLRDLRPDMDVVSSVAEKIAASGAPRWAERLRREPVEGLEDDAARGNWREAWIWAQQERYLRRIDGRARLVMLAKDRLSAAEELERVFRDVVRARTFFALHQGMSVLVKSSLIRFVAAIRRIGAGTGIRARRFRRDAREAMESCYSAVPCWIMPTWRVSESLPSIPGSFDLVIIDESSQSDVMALPAVLRGKKVLVVGDDKQVSPLAVGIEEKKIEQLRHNYLEGQPFSSMLLPGSSLYDLMGAVFPGQRIMLKEHFRCVEPIIRFSAREFYDNQIRPLRIPKPSERLDPPLVDILVRHGWRHGKVNLAEAKVIVDEIERIVQDPAFVERSIGVVSLVGAHQAQRVQAMLLERIGEELYMRHAIACGDSATFQGKERDIMFVSMVDAPNAHMTKTALLFRQRFNVALSRARDRMYLVRSVDESMLNPEDLNAKVIRHFKNPMESVPVDPGNEIDLCESSFEREVYTKLAGRGWRVRPQVKAGEYRIDLVVEGTDDRRLAIELDGDKHHGVDRWAADHVRQVALERIGWRFWRCWGSSWALDPDACFAELEAAMRSAGIEPLGREAQPTRYTEHRVVGSMPKTPEPESDAVDGAIDQQLDAGRRAPVAESISRLVAPDRPGTGTVQKLDHEERVVGPGDRVVIIYSDDPGRQWTLVLTHEENDDPSMGIIFVGRPIARALVGHEEDDVVQLPAGDSTREATILKIDKAVIPA